MKSGTSLMASVLMLVLMSLSSSCASSPADGPPRLGLQAIQLSPDFPGGFYEWDECVKKVLGGCWKHERRRKEYDLRKPEVRAELIAAGYWLMYRGGPGK